MIAGDKGGAGALDDLHYRHEHKHVIGLAEAVPLRRRLRAALSSDPAGGACGTYTVHSLYFDTPDDGALTDKLDGVALREKYRIRYYNDNRDLIRLEKKIKRLGLTAKCQALLTESHVNRIVNGDVGWLADSEAPLLRSLYLAWTTQILRPKVLIRYEREAYLHSAGNVRITLDSNVRAVMGTVQPFDRAWPAVPAIGHSQLILEVKYDEFIPAFIRDLIQVQTCSTTAASKYAMGRRYR